MKFLPANVRGTRDEARGYGYLVTLADGREEWHRLAWQATARAHGWIPPKEKGSVEQEQAKFEGWAVVEIFGHQRFAGFVTTEAFGQAVLFRVEVPPLEERERVTKHFEYIDGKSLPPGSTVNEGAVQGYSKLFGTGAIYAITPCTEEAAIKAVEAMQSRPLTVVKLAPERALAGVISDDSDDREPTESEGDF